MTDDRTFARYLEDHPASARLLECLRSSIGTLGPVTERASKSQIAFASGRTFARVWAPGQYLDRGAPLVLTVVLGYRDPSPRWKEIVETRPGRFTHHLELHSEEDIDDEVSGWLRSAREEGSPHRER